MRSCRDLGLDQGKALRDGLPSAFSRLAAFPEVKGALTGLHADGWLYGLSDGTGRQLDAVIVRAGLEVPLRISSVDEVGTYKPDARVCALGMRTAKLEPRELLVVSQNAWDVAGASSFGIANAWVNRAQPNSSNSALLRPRRCEASTRARAHFGRRQRSNRIGEFAERLPGAGVFRNRGARCCHVPGAFGLPEALPAYERPRG